MRHRAKMVLGWVCYRIVMVIPDRFFLAFGGRLLSAAGYYAYHPR